MITLHKVIIKFISANGTKMILLFPYSKFYVFRKSTKIETTLISCQYIRNNALRFLYFTIFHQGRNPLSQCFYIKCLFMEFVIIT